MNILLRRRGHGNGSCSAIQAASTTGLTVMRADRAQARDLHYIFRWGCTTTVDAPPGAVVINSQQTISWCNNKRGSRLALQEAGVSVPETWASENFRTQASWSEDPGMSHFVARPATHSQGRDLSTGSFANVYVYPGGYVSRRIDKVAEYRVMVVSGRVAWVAKKTPGNPEDVAWNVAQGGRFDNMRWGDWPVAVVKEALKAANVSGTDFSGVDVMVDEQGKAYVLELNSAPALESPYRQSCTAKCFDHIVINGREHYPMPEKFGWKHVIHPAVYTE